MDFERISLNPAVMGGKPCVRGTRVTVGMILGLLSTGVECGFSRWNQSGGRSNGIGAMARRVHSFQSSACGKAVGSSTSCSVTSASRLTATKECPAIAVLPEAEVAEMLFDRPSLESAPESGNPSCRPPSSDSASCWHSSRCW